MINLITESGDYITLKNGTVILIAVLFAIFTIGFYLLRSFGLYNLAKHAKEKKIKSKAYLSFIPCVWVYIAGKLAGKITLFGKEMKSYALTLSIVFTIGELAMIAFNAICYAPVAIHYLNGGMIFINNSSTVNAGNVYFFNDAISFDVAITPYGDMNKMASILSIMSTVSDILILVSDIMLIFVYAGLFKRYWPLHQTGASILSVLGLFPIMIFIIRKKKPINYQEFLRQRYQSMYGNQNPNNFYNGNPNPYQNPYQNGENANPFEDFDKQENRGKDVDPFDEFSDKK
ncbi:MAG: hypothetical protein MJ066_05930 [Clostridia bacterium]|nr:hypothetical protein [Clostridia bacterium]